jgi:hypothetical protein
MLGGIFSSFFSFLVGLAKNGTTRRWRGKKYRTRSDATTSHRCGASVIRRPAPVIKRVDGAKIISVDRSIRSVKT